MNWFYLALIPPALWAASNHIDKFLISKYFKGASVSVLAIISSLAGLVILPAVAITKPEAISIGAAYALTLTLCGLLEILGLHLYFWSMAKDDASAVVPLFQTTPIFSYLFGYFFLGEILSARQLLSAGIIIVGVIVISLNLVESKIKIKGDTLALMTAASLINAFLGFVIKLSAVHTNYWGTMFWSYLGLGLTGIALILFAKPYRREFLSAMQRNSWTIIGLNAANEMLSIAGILVMSYASLLAPLALISVAGTLQPAFVFVFGIILTMFFPHVSSETLAKKHLAQRIIAIIIIIIGSYLLEAK